MPIFFLKYLLIYVVVAAALISVTVVAYRSEPPLYLLTFWIAASVLWLVAFPIITVARLTARAWRVVKLVRVRLNKGEGVTSSDYYEVIEYTAAWAGKEAWVPRFAMKWFLRTFLREPIMRAIERKSQERAPRKDLPPAAL
jgi:hypothetical protein